MSNKIRWKLLFFDTILYLMSAVLILMVYPSSIYVLSPLQIVMYTVLGWVCVMAPRLGLRLYQLVWRYARQADYITLIFSDTIAATAFMILRAVIPNSITAVRAFSLFAMNLLGCLVVRLFYQWAYRRRANRNRIERATLWMLKLLTGVTFADEMTNGSRIRIAIVGAGSVGAMLADELKQNPRANYEPVCFVDVDKGKSGREIYGLPVLSPDSNLKEKLSGADVQEVVFALPNLSPERRQELFTFYREMGYKMKSYDYPKLGEAGKRELHDFTIEELLFRRQENFLSDETKAYYCGKSILITGGGGSIGSELARQIAFCKPSRLVLLDNYENGAYEIQLELKRKYPELNLRVEIASVCDREMMEKILREHTPDIVLHAAAHKHVPLMERNVCEAIKNNVFGTLTLAETCEKYGVGRFIMISTDKAVNPTNVMGATKRMCEMLILSRRGGPTKYSATRFGNVLGSNGSVIHIFEKQIAAGGPVTITDRRIIRYFMTIPEASQLVMTSGAMAGNGELYVLDMGKPERIWDLAEKMIRLSGLEPGKDIEIVETGLRPGEKLYEELLVKGEKLGKTENEKIFVEKDEPLSAEEIQKKLDRLRAAVEGLSNRAAREALKEAVPTYRSPEEVNEEAENRLQ